MLVDFKNMQQRQRANFINSITGYKSANLIGTVDEDNNSNLAVISSVVHLGSDPALLGFVMRPPTVPRHTYENILQTGVATLNHINADIVEQAHHTAARYDREVSEFAASGLDEHYDEWPAPFVAQSKLRIALSFYEEKPLEINNTVFMVMRIERVYVDGVVAEDGWVDLSALDTVTVNGLDSYGKVETIARLPYAKPKTEK